VPEPIALLISSGPVGRPPGSQRVCRCWAIPRLCLGTRAVADAGVIIVAMMAAVSIDSLLSTKRPLRRHLQPKFDRACVAVRRAGGHTHLGILPVRCRSIPTEWAHAAPLLKGKAEFLMSSKDERKAEHACAAQVLVVDDHPPMWKD